MSNLIGIARLPTVMKLQFSAANTPIVECMVVEKKFAIYTWNLNLRKTHRQAKQNSTLYAKIANRPKIY